MAGECLAVGSGAERVSGRVAGDHNYTQIRVGIDDLEAVAQFGVHPTGPGVVAFRARQQDHGNLIS